MHYQIPAAMLYAARISSWEGKSLIRSIAGAVVLLLAAIQASAANPDPASWDAVLEEARGQTVYWNAWGGSESVNAHIEWVAGEVLERHGVRLVHVKLDDTAVAVARVIAEKAVGKHEGGSVDLIWINGENFASMKKEGLLFSPGWAELLPNWRYVDVENKPTIRTDFTIGVEGLESPWGMAKLVFFHDSARSDTADMPGSIRELLAWAEDNPGRFTYPQPPDFLGSTFLKQALIELVDDRAVLSRPVEEHSFGPIAAPLFDYLDALHPLMWRGGRAHPRNAPAMKQLLADNEVDIIFAFNPAEASNAIARGELEPSVRSFVFTNGTLANTHFVAIPYNAAAKAGALVVANFLLSPEAQARKQDARLWGDPTVLAMSRLAPEDRALFEQLEPGPATLGPDELGITLEEPHPSWMMRLEREWMIRYAVAD